MVNKLFETEKMKIRTLLAVALGSFLSVGMATELPLGQSVLNRLAAQKIENESRDLTTDPIAADYGCTVVLNEAVWLQPHVQKALADANANVYAQLAKEGRDVAKAGKDALRYDAQGRLIIRVVFAYTLPGLARTQLSVTALEASLRQQLENAQQIYNNSKVNLAFEFAGLEEYAGKVDESATGLARVLNSFYLPHKSFVDVGFKPFADSIEGNYEATGLLRMKTQANAVVLLTSLVEPDALARAVLGTRTFSSVGAPLTWPAVAATSVPKVGLLASTLAHEIGHVMGQQHGPKQDAPTDEIAYRLRANYPYAMGHIAQNGRLGTAMTVNGLYTDQRFSSPTESIVLDESGTQVNYSLGETDKADSVKALNQDKVNFAYGTSIGLTAWNVNVVEYYSPSLNQYFRTADEGEQSYVDSGGAGDYKRTGDNFTGWSSWGSVSGIPGEDSSQFRYYGEGYTLKPVWRFYGSFPNLNSHFTTVDEGEAKYLRTLQIEGAGNPVKWHFESFAYRALPANAGTCPSGSRAVYRVYNGQDGSKKRSDGSPISASHRFTTSPSVYADMQTQGWKAEGVAFCAR